ncbi:hypothetical protein [Synechococcus sp. UW140]|uniref:hypothetical protein n=2 Tax=Synechococcus TaxID=1129 RepID=UPI003137CFB7
MAPLPSVSLLTTPLNILYGETGTLVLSLKEQAATGFSPWLELLVPAPSQHLAFGAASWAGGSLNANVLSFAGPEPSGPYTLKHPYTGELLRGNKGDRLLIWKPPVGSYAADAPALELRVPVAVSATSPTLGNVAIQAGGGYALGSDALDNSNVDIPVKAVSQPGLIIPQVIQLDKDPLTPEFETASGPNFARKWQLNIDVAAGQTLKDLKINDNLPLGPIYLGTNALAQNLISASALIEKQPKLNAAVTAANNELIINYGTVTGSTGDVDLQALVSFYIPQVLNQATATPITFTNTAKLAGKWTNPPLGSSADLEVVDQDAQPETITAKALAIQKTDDKPETLSPDGQELAGQVLPGETIEFKLDFQISDYFAFGDLSIEDILGDGLSYLAGTAKIQLQEQGESLTNGAFIPYLDRYLVSTKDYELGKDKLVFKLSEWLTGAALARADDGILQGGLVAAKAGATQGSILFKAKVDDQFVAPKAAGLTIKAADTLRNDVTLNGTIQNYIASSASFAPTNTIIQDVSAENLRIYQPTLEKTIVARNGQAFVAPLLFAPGDSITYRLKAILPTGDLQGVSLSDWLPTPAFNVAIDAINAVFENSGSGASPSQPPAAGTFAYGSEHTAPQLTNNQILVGPGTNQLTATLPNSSDVLNKQQILDIYYTVRATSAAMADRLSQTNISQLTYTSSDGTQHSTDLAVATAENLAPDLKIRKGVLNSTRDSGSTAASYTPTRDYGGVVFEAAGSTGLPFLSGNLTSAAISESGGNGSTGAIKNNILNSNISKLDAGDILRYVIVIENIGSSYRGAFNVQIRDEIPAGLSYHGNLAIVDGTGAALTYTKPDQTTATAADFFSASGVMIADPGATAASGIDGVNGGAIDGYSATSGRNIAVITFDAVVEASAYSALDDNGGLITNKAVIEDYANSENSGVNTFLPGVKSISETASLSLRTGEVKKAIVSTSELSTTNNNVAIGEIIRYRLQVDIPEGVLNSFELIDVLPAGLSFLNDGSAKLALAGTNANTFSWNLNNNPIANFFIAGSGDNSSILPTQAAPAPALSNNSKTLTWALGDLVNLDRDNSITESVILEFNALVDNISATKKGTTLENSGQFNFNGITSQSNKVTATVVEPQFEITKTVIPSSGSDAGDLLNYKVILKNIGNSVAFNLQVDDALGNLGANFDLQSVAIDSQPALANASISSSITNAASAATGDRVQLLADQLQPNESITFNYSGVLLAALQPGSKLTNEALIRYTSLPGERGSTTNPTGSSTPGVSGANNGERNGSGDSTAPNNYFKSTSVSINSRGFGATKTARLTSEPSSSANNLAIGEIVRFRLQAQLPEGNIKALQFVDSLPAGFEFIDDRSARLGFASASASNLTWNNGQLLANYYLAASGNNNSLIPTELFQPSLSNGNQTLTWNLGDVVNLDRDNNSIESVIAEFNARVRNIPSNKAKVDLINTATINTDNPNTQNVPNNAKYSETFSAPKQSIVEPKLSITKLASAPPSGGFQAGDLVTFTITISNGGSAAAFDLLIDDPLTDLGNSFNLQAVNTQSIPGAIDNSITSASSAPADRVSVVVPSLNPGQSLSFSYSGQLTSALQINSSLDNTATVSYSSLPQNGTEMGSMNQTGSANSPNSSGTGSGERNGSDAANAGGLNNYAAASTASIASRSIGFRKSLQSSSVADSSAANIYIGEVLRYRLQADFPGGTSTNVLLTDLLPEGISYLPGSSKLALASQASSELNLSNLANESNYHFTAIDSNLAIIPTAIYNDPIVAGANLSWAFGNVVNSNTSDQQVESLILEFDVVVANQKPINVNGRSLANAAKLEAGNLVGSDAIQVSSDALLLREPLLELKKSADLYGLDSIQNSQNSVVGYKLVITNRGTATAFDIDLRDRLPNASNGAQLQLITSSIKASPDTFSLALDNGPQLLHGTIAKLAAGELIIISYQAKLSDSSLVVGSPDIPNGALLNSAFLSYSSLPGVNSEERSGSDGVGNGLNNYAAAAGVAVYVSSYAMSSNPLILDEDNLPLAGADGPNTAFTYTSTTSINLKTGSFAINTGALKLGSSLVPLEGSSQSITGLSLLDSNGSPISSDGAGYPIIWDYGISAARTLRARANNIELLKVEFPSVPQLAPASNASIEVKATLSGAFPSHILSLADNNYSKIGPSGVWQGAVDLKGISLLFSDSSAAASNADNLTISIPLTILDDRPQAPLISGPTSACFGGMAKSGSFLISPGADKASLGLLIDANGNGSYDADVQLVTASGVINDLQDRSFDIAGKGVLRISTDVRSGMGSWTFIPAASGTSAASQFFSIGVRDGDGDLTLSNHKITLNTLPIFGDSNDRSLILNEDKLPNAGGENASAFSFGITDTANLVIQSGSLATTSIGFDPTSVGLAAIKLFRAGNDVTANLVDSSSNSQYSFAVTSVLGSNDTLTLFWAGNAIASLNLKQTALQIAAGNSGVVNLEAKLLGPMPSHLVKSQDGSYAPLVFENLPLQLQAADGCISSVSAALTVHDDRPALRLVNSSGGTTSSMAAGASTSGRWGRAIDSTGGFSSAVGADASAYANADFANSSRWELIVNNTTYPSATAAAGVSTPLGSLSVQTSGSWTFNALPTILNQEQLNFAVAVIDADGDRRSYNHRIVIQPASGPSLDGVQLVVDENNLPLANGKGPNQQVLFSDQKNLKLTAQTAEITSLVFSSTVADPELFDANGQLIKGMVWNRSTNGLLLTASYAGVDVLRLELPSQVLVAANSSAEVPLKVTLLAPLPHHATADDNYSEALASGDYNGAIKITGVPLRAMASNGQVAEATSSIVVLDDMPAELQLIGGTHTYFGSTIPLIGSFLVQPGADQGSHTVEFAANGSSISLNNSLPAGFLDIQGFGRFDVSVDFATGKGIWSFIANAPDGSAGNLDFHVAVKDADGDQRSASHSLAISKLASIDLGASGGQLVLNEDAIAIPFVGPDSPYTPTFNNTIATGAGITIKINLNSDSVTGIRFDSSRLTSIQANAPGLTFQLTNQATTLQVWQSSNAAAAAPIQVAEINLGAIDLTTDPLVPSVPISAKLLTNLISHASSQADNKYSGLDFANLPIVLERVQSELPPVTEVIKLRIYDDVPRVGIADPYADSGEEVQITALSGESFADTDTVTRTAPGGQVQGTWGALATNNEARSSIAGFGLDSALGADGLAAGPALEGIKTWQLWVDINLDGNESTDELFTPTSAAALDGTGPNSGLAIRDSNGKAFGRFKFWDSQATKSAGWAFKADSGAPSGDLKFRLQVSDVDGDLDSHLHRIEVADSPTQVGQHPTVNLYLLLDNSTSMKGADPATAAASNQTRLETQNRSAFIALQQAAALAGYGYYTGSNSPFFNFDDSSINNVLLNSSDLIANSLAAYQLADDPSDGILAGKINVHVIKYGYIVEYQKTEITPISVDEGISIAQQVLLTKTPDQLYGNSIASNPNWFARGLPAPSELDYYQGPNTLASNLYAGTEILGALTGLNNLLQAQLQSTAPGSLDTTLVAMSTDGRPERRYWWDNRPERGSTGIAVALPAELGGDRILSSGRLYDQSGNSRVTPTAAGVDQWSLTQLAMNSSLDSLAAKLASPSDQLQVSALGTGDGSLARFPKIYEDLLGAQTFDNSNSTWVYQWSGSSSLPPFKG